MKWVCIEGFLMLVNNIAKSISFLPINPIKRLKKVSAFVIFTSNLSLVVLFKIMGIY
jgi:hypothetical protein